MTVEGLTPPAPLALGLTEDGRRLDSALERVGGGALRAGNRLRLLRDGYETYEEWLTEIHTARRWVHLENYIFLDDAVGALFSEALRDAAARGVKVRVLADWFGSAGVPRAFWEEMRHGGVDLRLVNPPRLVRPLKVLQRDHRKFIGVDGRYASVGGVCIGDDWLERSPETGLPYRDTAVGVRGPAVADLEGAFARIWRRQGGRLPANERPQTHDIPQEGQQAVRTIVQEPGKIRLLWMMQMLAASVQRRFWIADAYFLSVPSLHRALITAAQAGVDVRLLTPSSNDVWLVGPLSRFGYRSLLEAGVRIWEYRGLMMHAKTSVIDGWWSRIGSTNLNFSGLLTNWELDVLVEDRGFAEQMEAMFEQDLEDSYEVRLRERRGKRRVDTLPRRPWRGRERRSRQRVVRKTSARAAAAVVQVGGAALSGDLVARQERLVMAGAGTAALGVAAVAARFPRLIAWPVAIVTGVAGASSLAKALRHRPAAEDGKR